MSEANKALTKRWFEEVWNKGRREAIAEILAPDAEIREAGEIVRGPDEFYPFFDRMQAAFSDIHVTFQDTIAEADMVCLRWSCSMKHTGGGLGIAPTQKTLATTGMTMVRVANGRFVAGWQNWDMLGLMQQIKQEPMAPTYLAAKVGNAV